MRILFIKNKYNFDFYLCFFIVNKLTLEQVYLIHCLNKKCFFLLTARNQKLRKGRIFRYWEMQQKFHTRRLKFVSRFLSFSRLSKRLITSYFCSGEIFKYYYSRTTRTCIKLKMKITWLVIRSFSSNRFIAGSDSSTSSLISLTSS